MRRKCAISFLVCFLLSGSFLRLEAAGAGPVFKPGVSRELKATLPDLVVSEIGLNAGCRVVLVVKNVGEGRISGAGFQRGQILVSAGGRQELIPFVKADTRGALKSPGGTVRVESRIKLEQGGVAQAEVDSARTIDESDEGNNRRRVTLVPRCETAADGAQDTRPAAAAAPTTRTAPAVIGTKPTGLVKRLPEPLQVVLPEQPLPETQGVVRSLTRGGTPQPSSGPPAGAEAASAGGGAGAEWLVTVELRERHDGGPYVIDGGAALEVFWRTGAAGPFRFDLMQEDGQAWVARLDATAPRDESHNSPGSTSPTTYSCSVQLNEALKTNPRVTTPGWYRIRVTALEHPGLYQGEVAAAVATAPGVSSPGMPVQEGAGESDPQAGHHAVEAASRSAVQGLEGSKGVRGVNDPGGPSGLSKKHFFTRGTREVEEKLDPGQIRNRWSRRRINIDEDIQPVEWCLIPNNGSKAWAGGSFQSYTGAVPAINPKWAGFIFRSQAVFPVEQFRDTGREFVGAWIEIQEGDRRAGAEGTVGGKACSTSGGYVYIDSGGQRVYALTSPWDGNAIDTPGYQIGEIPASLEVNYSSHIIWNLGDLVRDWISGAKPNHGILIGSRWDTFPEWSCFTDVSYYRVKLHLAFKEAY